VGFSLVTGGIGLHIRSGEIFELKFVKIFPEKMLFLCWVGLELDYGWALSRKREVGPKPGDEGGEMSAGIPKPS